MNKWLGPTVLCCTSIVLPAVAASPIVKVANARVQQPTPIVAVHSAAPLDLRPPQLPGPTVARFADFGHVTDAGEDRRLAPLGAAMNQEHAPSRTEAFIQRFHREGLPLARLWQGHASVVSVGLNPKGKPGVWWVKQTH